MNQLKDAEIARLERQVERLKEEVECERFAELARRKGWLDPNQAAAKNAELTRLREQVLLSQGESVSQRCRRLHLQSCDFCDDMNCADNTSPAKEQLWAKDARIAELEKERDDDRALFDMEVARHRDERAAAKREIKRLKTEHDGATKQLREELETARRKIADLQAEIDDAECFAFNMLPPDAQVTKPTLDEQLGVVADWLKAEPQRIASPAKERLRAKDVEIKAACETAVQKWLKSLPAGDEETTAEFRRLAKYYGLSGLQTQALQDAAVAMLRSDETDRESDWHTTIEVKNCPRRTIVTTGELTTTFNNENRHAAEQIGLLQSSVLQLKEIAEVTSKRFAEWAEEKQEKRDE